MRALAMAALLLTLGPAQAAERGSDRHVRDIIQQALDDALQDQVQHLFASWLKDSTGQPKRAAAGIRKAVASYRAAIRAIETEQLTGRATARKRRDAAYAR